MTRSERFIVEGEWSGYTSAQRHVVHRTVHYGNDRARYEALTAIRYTDGTSLLLTVRLAKRGEQVVQVHGYDKLIADCLKHNVTSVHDLGLAELRERHLRGGVVNHTWSQPDTENSDE